MNQSHKQMNKPKSKDIEKHKLPQECHLSAKNIITFNNILSFHHSSLPSAQVSFKDYIFFLMILKYVCMIRLHYSCICKREESFPWFLK